MNIKKLTELWEKFGDILIDNNENIDIDFHIFKKGTDRYEIWHWFEDKGFGIGEYWNKKYKENNNEM